jgi:phage terminase large subunit GpA-like protein
MQWTDAALASMQRSRLSAVARRLSRTTPRQLPDLWAAANRIYPPSSGWPGPRNVELTPYIRDVERAAVSGRYRRVVLVTAAQSGKTECYLDLIGERLHTAPAPIIVVLPSKEFAVDQFSPRLEQLLEQSPSLAGKVLGGLHSKAQKKTLKRVAGVRVRLAHAGSSAALKSDPAALCLVDEYDELLRDVRGQGDPLGLAEARGASFSDFVAVIASTPSKGNVEVYTDPASGLELWALAPPEDLESPIWLLWQQGTCHHWAWPCLQCGEYFIPRFSCLKWHEPEGGRATPALAHETAHVVCPRCGGVHEERHKIELNRRGRYAAPGQSIGPDGNVIGEPPQSSTASFWVSGLASPFVTFGRRAADHLSNVRLGDMDRIRTSINASFGELHAPGVGELPEWSEVLKHRGDYARGELPEGVLALVMTVDVQRDRLLVAIRGWGARATSWLIDWGELNGETAELPVWADLIDLMQTPLHGMPLRAVLIDSGFRPGLKDDLPVHRVYDFARRFPRLVRACRGSSWPMRVPLMRSRIEVDHRGGTAKYGLQILRLDTDHWKSWVHERLRWPMGEPGAWHLPRDVDEEYCKQVVSEVRSRAPSGRVTWVQRFKENHALDLESMQAAAGYLLGAHRARERPPQAQATAEWEETVAPAAAWRSTSSWWGPREPREW